ncbi:thermostable hemolysin [Chitiniphilus purpureus]|uniref:Thermostable hemolysin n=1 Tax=Chitiniphilus purpureus TaxID=2981137 RepID=A0ABY6DRZ0_9NEIS|nr:thermostable hemolysin [Chitiniphilus sp. CD1]UXY17140.1 thermostable hemolysin [Chitiniphilus sp. CD1]
MQIKVVLPNTQDWELAVRLVRYKYRSSFQAEVDPSPDCFIACLEQDADGEANPVACAGITFSELTTLFSEQYLGEPVEVMIGRHQNKEVSRNAIIEVGSLASIKGQAGSELVRVMPLLGWCMGKEFILCTATKQLRALLEREGIRFIPLCPAHDSALEESMRQRWGSYYDQAPQTGFISLASSMAGLAHQTGRYRFDNIVVNLNPWPEEVAEYAVA